MTMRLNQSQVSGISSPSSSSSEERFVAGNAHVWCLPLILSLSSQVLDIFHHCSLGDLTVVNGSLFCILLLFSLVTGRKVLDFGYTYIIKSQHIYQNEILLHEST